MTYIFPRTRFVGLGDLSRQLRHVEAECVEVWCEYTHNVDYAALADELNDLRHSVETALRMIEEQGFADVAESTARVQAKNEARGYYE